MAANYPIDRLTHYPINTKKMNILLVEDDPIIAARLEMNLQKMGYEVSGILPRGEDVPGFVAQNPPDLILLDIQLEGDWDGIRVARELGHADAPPIIFLTANADDHHFAEAKKTQAVAFLSKPYNAFTLQFSIEQALRQAAAKSAPAAGETGDDEPQPEDFILLKDRVFVRVKDRLVKIALEDIWYLEAESNYSRLWTSHKEYILAATLKKMEAGLPEALFMRVHRSFLVNISKIDEISEGYIYIGIKRVPLARGFREKLVHQIRTL